MTNRITAGAVAVLIVMTALLMIPANKKVIVSADSVKYISTAENLLRGKGYVDYGGKKLSAAPPVYPLLFAAFRTQGMNRDQCAVSVNMLALFAVGLFTWLILGQLGVVGWWRWLAVLAVMAFPNNVQAAEAALTELVFLGFALAWCYSLFRDGWKWLVASAVLGVLMTLTRHAGAGMLIGAAFVLKGGKRWLATLPGILAILLWTLTQGTGENTPTWGSPWSDIWQNLQGYWHWLVALIPFAIAALWQKQKVLLAAATGWAVAIMFSCWAIDIGDPATRMITPAVILLLIGLFTLTRRLERIALLLVLATFAVQSHGLAFKERDTRAGFNTSAWKKSETLARIDSIPDRLVFSNAPDGIWYQTGRVTQPLPRSDGRSPQIVNPRKMDGFCVAVFFKQQLGRYYYPKPQSYAKRVLKDENGKEQAFEYPDAYVLLLGQAK